VWASGCRIAAERLTLTGGADRVGVRMPDSGQTPTSRRQSTWLQGRDFRRWTRHRRTWGHGGGNGGTCRIAAKQLRRDASPQATTSVNAARANGGTRGRERRLGQRRQAAPAGSRPSGCRHAAATGHNARERDTGERRGAGRRCGQHLPDRDQAGTRQRRQRRPTDMMTAAARHAQRVIGDKKQLR